MLAGLSALVLVTAFGGSSLASQSSREEAPCLKQRHLPAFTAYNLGREFAGLPLTSVERFCFAPGPRRHRVGEPASVAWTSEATYGTCTPEAGSEGVCDPPLEIQSYPECDRNFSSYGGVVEPAGALSPRNSFFLGGSYKIPTAAFEYGHSPTRLEIYTGQTTVVIYTAGVRDPPTLARRAAHALTRLIAPKLTGTSAARLRALAVDPHGCHRSTSK
jgi:hypothetical protein